MHEIMRATYELIDELDKSDLIKELIFYKDKVLNNKDLCDLINKGKNCDDKYLVMDIKRKLYNNGDYKNYINSYNQLYYIIMDINQRYNKVLNSKSCGKY